jgi:hypothetical protein
VKRIGSLLSLTENDPEARARIAAFRQGLETAGWAEARNIRKTIVSLAATPDVFATMSRSWWLQLRM